ncbi:UNVERIFIED_CONTAM: hypothetical protein K2H54_044868 [Gekko kuhli]
MSGLATNEEGRLRMEVNSSSKSTKLSISKVEWEDDAIFYCAVSDTVVRKGKELAVYRLVISGCDLCSIPTLMEIRCFLGSNTPGWKMTPNVAALAVLIMAFIKGSGGQSVNQSEGTVAVIQGHPVFLECKYKPSSTQDYPFWYVQHPGEPPKIFLKDLGRDGSEEGALQGFDAKHDKNLKTFHMTKATSQLSDSAIYFCAVFQISLNIPLLEQVLGEVAQTHKEEEVNSRAVFDGPHRSLAQTVFP